MKLKSKMYRCDLCGTDIEEGWEVKLKFLDRKYQICTSCVTKIDDDFLGIHDITHMFNLGENEEEKKGRVQPTMRLAK